MAKIFQKTIVTQVVDEDLVKKRHKQIVDAASKIFSKRGFYGTNMRSIAAASRLNISYLYKYIASKEDILFLFYKELYKQWILLYQSLIDEKKENPREQLKNFIRLMLELVHKNKREILTMYTESRHLNREYLPIVLSAENEMVKSLENLIIRGVKEGYFKTKDPFMAANFIQFLLVIESLRGWNFMGRCTFERFVKLITSFALKVLEVEEKL